MSADGPHPLVAVAREHWTPAAEAVAKLPRITCKPCRDSRSKVCEHHTKSKCPECRQNITGAHMHLDYVGHADVNRTLTEIDAEWSWEPLAFDDQGIPLEVERGGTIELWGRLTLHGKPVLCVGSCESNKTDVAKELIGDLIRNGAMRHNVYGALWSKAERDGVPERDEPKLRRKAAAKPPADENGEPLATKDQEAEFSALLAALEFDDLDRKHLFDEHKVNPKAVTREQAAALIAVLKAEGWDTHVDGGGQWHAVPAGEDAPFMDADVSPLVVDGETPLDGLPVKPETKRS